MVLPLGVALQLIAVEVHLAQFASCVPIRLVVEVRRQWMATFTACGDGDGSNAVAEFDHGDEAVTARAVPLLRSRIGARAERGERPPARRGEADWDTGPGVVELRIDVCGETLKSIDVAPRRLPTPEVAGQLVGGRGECLEPLVGRSVAGGVVIDGEARRPRAGGHPPSEILGPEDGKRSGYGGRR